MGDASLDEADQRLATIRERFRACQEPPKPKPEPLPNYRPIEGQLIDATTAALVLEVGDRVDKALQFNNNPSI